MKNKTLVLGLGNTLLGDEGAGVYAVRALQEKHEGLTDVEFLDGGTLSFTLAGPIEEALGSALALGGVSLPTVETGIASSVLVLGLLIVVAARLPLMASMMLVGVFALFHGHAHGQELPQAASALFYIVWVSCWPPAWVCASCSLAAFQRTGCA